MQSGARICPRCATRVDERRARTSPFCLTCGAPLGAAAGGSRPPPPPRSPLLWVFLGIGGLLLLGTCGLGAVVLAVRSSEPTGPSFGPLTTSDPKLESTATPTTPPTIGGPKPKPTVTPTVIASPRPTVPPIIATPPPPVDAGVAALQPFPRARANAELDRVNATIQTCHKTGDPTGSGVVKVDFEPDNRTTVTLRPPFASTSTGFCMSARFQSIRVGKFEGPRESIDRTFRFSP